MVLPANTGEEYHFRPTLRYLLFFCLVYFPLSFWLIAKLSFDERIEIVFDQAALGFGAVAILWRLLVRYTSLYSLTPQHISWRRGIIARDIMRVPVQRVTDYRAIQSVTQRLFAVADLQISTAGTDGKDMVFTDCNTSDVERTAALIEKLIMAQKPASTEAQTAA